jgi:hypothetical protein
MYLCYPFGDKACITHAKYVRSSIVEGHGAQRLNAKAKQLSYRSVIGWVTKIYYHELLRASEGTLSCWSRLHLQSLASTPV